MRKAAGIMLIIYGAVLLYVTIGGLISEARHIRDPVFTILFMVIFFAFIVTGAFIIIGGVFCLKRKYWKLCFASALLAVLMMIFWWPGIFGFLPRASAWWVWSSIIAGILPLIFVCIRKREWQEISDIMDSKASNDG